MEWDFRLQSSNLADSDTTYLHTTATMVSRLVVYNPFRAPVMDRILRFILGVSGIFGRTPHSYSIALTYLLC